MAYNPTIWINDDGTGTVGTPVIADYMNNLEQGVKNNELAIGEHTKQINVLVDKETIYLTAKTGYSILQQNCYEQVGKLFVNVQIKKTDNTAFTTGTGFVPCSFPKSYDNICVLSYIGLCGSWASNGGGLVAGMDVVVNVITANTTVIVLSGSMDIDI